MNIMDMPVELCWQFDSRDEAKAAWTRLQADIIAVNPNVNASGYNCQLLEPRAWVLVFFGEETLRPLVLKLAEQECWEPFFDLPEKVIDTLKIRRASNLIKSGFHPVVKENVNEPYP